MLLHDGLRTEVEDNREQRRVLLGPIDIGLPNITGNPEPSNCDLHGSGLERNQLKDVGHVDVVETTSRRRMCSPRKTRCPSRYE